MSSKNNIKAASHAPGRIRKKNATGTALKTNRRTLHLTGQLGIREVNDLKAKLTTLLEVGRRITLDASKLEKIDTSALQLLTAFYRSAIAKSIEVKWKNPSNRLLRAAELLGLSEPLGLGDIPHQKND